MTGVGTVGGRGLPQFLAHGLLFGVIIIFPVVALGETPMGSQEDLIGESQGLAVKPQEIPVVINADRIEYDRDREVYHATGSVDVTRGPVHLNADEAILQKLTGRLTAIGHVHLRDEETDVWAEQLQLNLNTEAGVITSGRIYWKEQNSLITGRRFQRFSEIHYRVKEGSFTNCDALEGQVPAWRFTFDDIDVDFEDSLFGKGVWFHVNDVPVLPFPTFLYPLGASRKTGLLFPTVGYNSSFGASYRQSFFWAISPSQDLTVTPNILTNRGGGADLQYRYIWSREAKGRWFVSPFRDTEQDRTRALLRGAHAQQFTPDLSLRTNMNLSTDRDLLQNLSSSGIQRALPSQTSNLTILQRLDHGALYFWGQYIQPLNAGGDTTFQRLPEVGHWFEDYEVFGSPFVLTADTTAVEYFRPEGFNVGRLDFLPGLSMEGLHLGHFLGFRPQVKFREVAYTRGLTEKSFQHRETFWIGPEAYTHVTKQFSVGEGRIRHSIEPRVIYEYVPETKRDELVTIDAVDELIKKNLITYSINNRLSHQGGDGVSSTWLDLLLAQSYHPGELPALTSRFSDIWIRGDFHKPLAPQHLLSALNVTVDAFFDPSGKDFSQMNTDALFHGHQAWYVVVGQRYTEAGPRVRRGDIWNPVSFNEVLAPAPKILFLTAGGGVRLPYGVTLGTKWYHDFRTGQTAEWDVVGLYQNPCRCFSLGLSYSKLSDRSQVDFLVSLTGLWGTQGQATQMMKAILGPIMSGEKGLPWDYR